MQAATTASIANLRSREAILALILRRSNSTSRLSTRGSGSGAYAGSSRVASRALSQELEATRITKKLQKYLSNEKRPNVYIALYYNVASNKIGVNSNANVLVYEDKHRKLKLDITSTNY